MHFIKYFAIFVLLTVQYSFQESSSSSESLSSSEEQQLEVTNPIEISSTIDEVPVDTDKRKKFFFKSLGDSIKEKSKKFKDNLKHKFSEDNIKNELKNTNKLLGETLKKGKNKLKDSAKNMKKNLAKFFKGKTFSKSGSDENDTRLKRSIITKIRKVAKNAVVSKAKKALKKLF
uniref:DUF148 domain-containing protein n=1 Tax=Strongyloides papillosus TaxID=174720 RepID=A0A0N5C5T6_STREA